jgi:hypothetical protein
MRPYKCTLFLAAVLGAAMISLPILWQQAQAFRGGGGGGGGFGGGFSGGSFRGAGGEGFHGAGFSSGNFDRGGGYVSGPRNGDIVEGPGGGFVAEGPRGGGAVEGPGGAGVARGPEGGAAVRGPDGGVYVEGADGGVYEGYRGGRVNAGGGWDSYYAPGWGGVAVGPATGLAVGAFVASLPLNAAAVVVSTQAYYVADGVYYQQCFTSTETGYCVVAAP